MAVVSLEAGFDLFVGFGALIMVVNIPMLLFIYSHSHLRKQKEVVTIGFVCFADLVNAMGYFFAGIYRLEILHSGQENDLWQNLNCTRKKFDYSYQLIGASTLTITIDRVIAVTVPLKYRTYTWRYAYALVGFALSLVLLGFLVCIYFWFSLRPSSVSILCYTSTAYGPEIWVYMISIRQYSTVNIPIFHSIILYIPIALRVVFLKRKSRAHQTVIRGANPHRRLVKTTVLIGFTLLCEIIFVMIPDLFLNFNLFGLKQYELVWYLFVISKGIINIFLYSFNHDDIKGALLNKLPARMKQRLTSLFTIRDHSSRAEQSHTTHRTQATTTRTTG